MISVIIPIYNAEPYLRRCIDSVLKSTYRDFELILVDDGSTDGSLRICQEYSDCRIKLIVQENQGVSAARNRGLDECAGEWVVFVDADDVVSRDFLALIAGEEADLILFDFAGTEQELLSAGRTAEKMRFGEEQILPLLKRFLVPSQLRKEGNVNFISPWAKVYKKSIIDRHTLRFSSELFRGEDRLFNLEYQLKIKNYLYIPQPVYFYNIHDDSLSHRPDYQFLENQLKLFEKIQFILKADNLFFSLQENYFSFILNSIAYDLVWEVFRPDNGKTYHEKRELCREIQKNPLNRQALKYNSVCGPIRRRILLLFFHLKWYCVTDIICRLSITGLIWRRYCRRICQKRGRESS